MYIPSKRNDTNLWVDQNKNFYSLGDFRPSRPACFHPSNMGNNTLHGGYNEYNVDNGDKKNKKLDKETMKNVYNGIKRACGSPPRERGAVSFVEGRPVDYSMDFRLLNLSHFLVIIMSTIPNHIV